MLFTFLLPLNCDRILSRYDVAGDSIVLRLRDQATFLQFYGIAIRAAGYDFLRRRRIYPGKGLKFLRGRFIDIQGPLFPEAVKNSLCYGLRITGGSGRHRCGVLSYRIGAALGGRATNRYKQT